MKESGDILVFDRAEAPEGDRHMRGVLDLTLRAGETARLLFPGGWQNTPVADLACGLVMPSAGAVRFEGVEWTNRPPDDAAACRGRIGRVFAGPAWVSNLDLDENILLAVRHHGRLGAREARDRAETWARRFGWDRLPVERPAWADPGTLRIAQWIRALLGDPDLLLLEQPLSGVAPAAAEAFLQAVEETRSRGAAVLWLSEASAPMFRAEQCFRFNEERWEPDE